MAKGRRTAEERRTVEERYEAVLEDVHRSIRHKIPDIERALKGTDGESAKLTLTIDFKPGVGEDAEVVVGCKLALPGGTTTHKARFSNGQLSLL